MTIEHLEQLLQLLADGEITIAQADEVVLIPGYFRWEWNDEDGETECSPAFIFD